MRSCISPPLGIPKWISHGGDGSVLSLLPLDVRETDRPTARLTNAMAQEGDVKAQIEELKSGETTKHQRTKLEGRSSI